MMRHLMNRMANTIDEDAIHSVIPTGMYAGMTYIERFRSLIVERDTGCHEWIGKICSNGYGMFNCKTVGYMSHRLAFWDANRVLPSDLVVMHICDNRKCCNHKHLSLGSQSDNMQDAIAKGRLRPSIGEFAGKAKLSTSDVMFIREKAESGMSYKDIASLIGVTQKQAGVIARGVQWCHVGGVIQKNRRTPGRIAVTETQLLILKRLEWGWRLWQPSGGGGLFSMSHQNTIGVVHPRKDTIHNLRSRGLIKLDTFSFPDHEYVLTDKARGVIKGSGDNR